MTINKLLGDSGIMLQQPPEIRKAGLVRNLPIDVVVKK